MNLVKIARTLFSKLDRFIASFEPPPPEPPPKPKRMKHGVLVPAITGAIRMTPQYFTSDEMVDVLKASGFEFGRQKPRDAVRRELNFLVLLGRIEKYGSKPPRYRWTDSVVHPQTVAVLDEAKKPGNFVETREHDGEEVLPLR